MLNKWGKVQWIIFIASAIITMGAMHLCGASNLAKESSNRISADARQRLSVEVVYDLIIKHRIKHPNIVLKQAICETGWFKSRVCKANHNLFGLHNGRNYLKFKTYEESIEYYKNWQILHYKTNGDYYQFLKDYQYASDTNYIYILKHIKTDV
jgi:uncharacterized FlgJ-related protein